MLRRVGPLVIVQARVGSQRLPGKVLADVCGRPLLGLLLDRLRPSRRTSGVLVATSDRLEDNAVADLCHDLGVETFRGSADDVLGRVTAAARRAGAEAVVRISGDSPLLDHNVLDRVVEVFDEGTADLVQNHRPARWPVGTAVEVLTDNCLAALDRSAITNAHREHVTLYAYETPGTCTIRFAEPPPELTAPDLRICVDTDDDLARIRSLCAAFAPRTDMSMAEIVAYTQEALAR